MTVICQAKGCEELGRFNIDSLHYCAQHRFEYLDYVDRCNYQGMTGECEMWDDEQMQAWREQWDYLWENTADNGSEESA